MPNKWIGRAAALVSALVSGVIGWFVGQWIGGKLAFGFTFDWYVHPGKPAYGLHEVLPHVASTSGLAAFLSVTTGVFLTAATTRLMMKRLRFTPPRYRAPMSTDVHFGRLAIAALVAAPLLGILLAYVLLATPLLAGVLGGAQGTVIQNVSDDGFQLLLAGASAFFSFAATLVAHLTTEAGIISGHIVPKSDRNLIARISLFGMRNAKTTVALVLGVTLVAGAYASTITTNVDVADVCAATRTPTRPTTSRTPSSPASRSRSPGNSTSSTSRMPTNASSSDQRTATNSPTASPTRRSSKARSRRHPPPSGAPRTSRTSSMCAPWPRSWNSS